MFRNNPLEQLAMVLAHAQYVAFPPLAYEERDWDVYKKTGTDVRIKKTRPLRLDDLTVYAMFPQTWSSTALGFGGLGGQAITTAYTIVVECVGSYAVYFDGRFAYKIPRMSESFDRDIRQQRLRSVLNHTDYL